MIVEAETETTLNRITLNLSELCSTSRKRCRVAMLTAAEFDPT